MLGMDRHALVRRHVEASVRALRQARHPREAVDFRPELSRRRGIGLRRRPGVDMAAIGAPQRADEETLLDEHVAALSLGDRDDLGLHAEIAGAARDKLEIVYL